MTSIAYLIILIAPAILLAASVEQRWSTEQANNWYRQQSWFFGSNYVPSNAINQLDMWQKETFDIVRIEMEFGWAKDLGLNTMRIFLHDKLWFQDSIGFKQRIDTFLKVSSKYGIKPLFVLFDSCWDPYPELGLQHPPTAGVHNSGWVQGPGSSALNDQNEYGRLEDYVKDIIGSFSADDRILGWDLWNEPDNDGGGNYKDDVAAKKQAITNLLPLVFSWARSANNSQPLTSGLWHHDNWDQMATLNEIEKTQVSLSDIISFHDYGWPEVFESRVKSLQVYGRPIICTEFMARGAGSIFDTVLQLGHDLNIGMVMWGFVNGKTQTHLPWDSWDRPYTSYEPTVWFHDLLYADGSPYRQREVEIITSLTKANHTSTKLV